MLREALWLNLAALVSLLLLCTACSQTQGIGLQAKPTWDHLQAIEGGQGGDIPDPRIHPGNSGDPGDSGDGGQGGSPVSPAPPPGPPARIEFGEFDRKTHLLSVKVFTPGFAGNLKCDVPESMYVWREERIALDIEHGEFEYIVGIDAADFEAGAAGELKVSVASWGDMGPNPAWESHDTATKAILIAPAPAMSTEVAHLKDDTLYAIPQQFKVEPGEPVTIVVAMGRPANPFQYMTGVRVTVPQSAGMQYVRHTFNVGAPGGAREEADGYWSRMAFAAGGPSFLLAPDVWHTVIDAGDGLAALDFNLTPLGGRDTLVAAGALFNFKARFDNPGRWQLGFQQSNVVNRVYYQDGNQSPDYFWGDITNDYPGIANSVTVVF